MAEIIITLKDIKLSENSVNPCSLAFEYKGDMGPLTHACIHLANSLTTALEPESEEEPEDNEDEDQEEENNEDEGEQYDEPIAQVKKITERPGALEILLEKHNPRPARAKKTAKITKPKSDEWEGHLNHKEVAEKIGCSDAALYTKISTGVFPKADKKIGIKNAWDEETITDWQFKQGGNVTTTIKAVPEEDEEDDPTEVFEAKDDEKEEEFTNLMNKF